MATTTTGAVNEALYYMLAISALLFVAIVFFMVLFLVRYRASRSPNPSELHGNLWIEVGVVVISTILALTFFWYGLTGYQFLRRVPQGALQIQVHSKQFAWSFEYPDGKRFPDLVVPVGSDVRCNITSDDVIHGFYVPALRIQVDAVPGIQTYTWFHAKDIGSYDILCTVYCGTAHSAMMAKLYVLSEEQFQKWKATGEIELEAKDLPMVEAEHRELLASFGCLSCHSTGDGPGIAPSFKGLYGSTVSVIEGGEKRSLVADEDYLAELIRSPHAKLVVDFDDIMPPPDAGLRAGDVDDLVEAIKSLR